MSDATTPNLLSRDFEETSSLFSAANPVKKNIATNYI